MRTIGYGSKGKAESVEKQVARELEIVRYCSLRTTVRGRQSTQDIALFIYHDAAANLSGSGLVVVSFDKGGEIAKQFADAWFEKTDASLRKGLPTRRATEQGTKCHVERSRVPLQVIHYLPSYRSRSCRTLLYSQIPRIDFWMSVTRTEAVILDWDAP